MPVGRRPLVITLSCLALGLIGYELWPRDETRIARLLTEVCSRLNRTRDPRSLEDLRVFMGTALKAEVQVHADELATDIEGLGAARDRAQVLLDGPPLDFALNGLQIRISGKLARADADLLVTVRGSGEQRREVRRTRVRLVKVSETNGSHAAWQIEAIEVDAVRASEPEARP